MRGATHPSTHRVPSWFVCSGRARLRPSRSAGCALFEHRADGPPVPSKRQAGSVAPQEHRLPEQSVSSTNHAQRDCLWHLTWVRKQRVAPCFLNKGS